MTAQHITTLAQRCRAAYDKGARLSQAEAAWFVNSLRAGDMPACERLVQTAELVAEWEAENK